MPIGNELTDAQKNHDRWLRSLMNDFRFHKHDLLIKKGFQERFTTFVKDGQKIRIWANGHWDSYQSTISGEECIGYGDDYNSLVIHLNEHK